MVDLPPGTPYNMQVANCCRGGVLSSLVQSNVTSTAAFQMVVGQYALATDGGGKEPEKPWHFDIGVPGYTCSNATTVAPTRYKVDKNRYAQMLCKDFISSCIALSRLHYLRIELNSALFCCCCCCLPCSDMAGDLLVLAVPGVGGAVVLRLHDDVLQRDDCGLPALQLRLPRVLAVATMRQAKPVPHQFLSCSLTYIFLIRAHRVPFSQHRSAREAGVAGGQRQRRAAGADRLVLRAHVPDPGALAREGELPEVLAGEGDGVQLQPGEELQRLEPGAAAPEPAKPDATVQLQLQASHRVRQLQ